MFHDLNLPQPALQDLSDSGLVLGGLVHARQLAAASRLEGPTSIQAAIAPGATLDVGAFCNLTGGKLNNLRTGRYCSIADGVSIGTHEHPVDWLTSSRTAYYPQVNNWHRIMLGKAAEGIGARIKTLSGTCPMTTLGADVWIGQGAFLKAGVTVGTGAIIGARATVVKDVPPYAIVVGTPARVIRLRFSEAVVERLLESTWWQYSIYDLFDVGLSEPMRALDQIEERRLARTLWPYVGPIFTAADLSDPKAVADRLRAAIHRHASGPENGPDPDVQ